MNWNILNSTDQTHRAPTIKALLALVAVVGFAGVAILGGGVAAEEVANDTVEVTNETGSIYVEAEFASGIDDANATADVTITDANGTEFVSETISGNASETIVEEYAINDSDPAGNYTVVVDADSGVINSSDVGTFAAGSGGGGAGGIDGWGTYQGYPVWMLVLVAIAAVLFGHSREWWDLSEVAP